MGTMSLGPVMSILYSDGKQSGWEVFLGGKCPGTHGELYLNFVSKINNETKFEFELHFYDRFNNNNKKNLFCAKIIVKSAYTIQIWFDLTRFGKYVSV